MLTLKQAENAFRSGAPPVDGDGTFESFLYGYEPKLNEIVRKFLGKRAFDPETFMDYKLSCAASMLERWNEFDPGKGIQFSTFAHHDVINTLLRARMLEEAGSFSNLDEYKSARRMGALMYGTEQREAVDEFIKKRGCLEATARRFLKIAQLMLNSSSLENDAEASYSWDYVDVLWDGVRAYRRAVEKLTLNLVELGELHAVRIERVALGTYRYQADNDGYWGEFTLDPVTGEQKISALAELDTTKTNRFAKQAARYLRVHTGEKLPKRILVAFE